MEPQITSPTLPSGYMLSEDVMPGVPSGATSEPRDSRTHSDDRTGKVVDEAREGRAPVSCIRTGGHPLCHRLGREPRRGITPVPSQDDGSTR